ncbi:hypothetical protein ACSBOB_32145 [Mesorhizobium sp. ASY16-5R]|uniref:hypothetical protein n=1 Tax=Mesorhizobium sp. ASY16-5R TaxID=3445772 RepID=UPI003FA17236
MGIEAGQERIGEAVSHDFVRTALAAQSGMWPEVRIEFGDLEPGWITAERLFASDTAIDEYLDYQGSFHRCADRKTCAAAMVVDYCYIFSIATVPLFAGLGSSPTCHPPSSRCNSIPRRWSMTAAS